MKKCVLNDSKNCTLCSECEICDLDPTKTCDNCMRCVDYDGDYSEIIIDEIKLN